MNKKFIYMVILIIVLGALFHFVYELSGNNFIVGLFTPINESIWEHTKLVVLPTVIGWYIFNRDSDNFYLKLFITIIISIILIISIYYIYHGIFGANILLIDILIFIISVIIGNYFGINLKLNLNIKRGYLLIILLFIIYGYLTINPIDIPLFTDFAVKIYF